MGMKDSSYMQIAHYTIDRQLGSGAQGDVFLAHNQEGQAVALKVLKAELSSDKEIAGRFQRESQVAMSIRHPHVVAAVDAGVNDKGQPWLAYQYITGGDLEQLIAQQKRIPPLQALTLMRGIIAGLGALDAAGLIHRDIKPANILLHEDGRAMITDHGLARSTNDARTQYTMTGMIIGSPAYMAPEQIEGADNLDIRADLYGAGIMWYELLTGNVPYTADTVIALLHQHLDAPLPTAQHIIAEVPTIDPRQISLLCSLLAKKPSQRPARPQVVLDQLDKLLKQGADPAADAYPKTIDAAPADAYPQTIDAASAMPFPMTIDENTPSPTPSTINPPFRQPLIMVLRHFRRPWITMVSPSPQP